MAGSIYETVLRIRTELGDSLAQFDKLRAKVKSTTGEVNKSARLTRAQDVMKDIGARPTLAEPSKVAYGQGKRGGQVVRAEHNQYADLEGMLHKVKYATRGVGQSYQEAAQNAKLHTTSISRMEPQISHVATTMKENGKVSSSVSNTYRMLGGQYQLVSSRTNEVSRSHERFQMHLLSVMFFGMAIQRVFMGYIKQVLQLTGVTDLLSATMTLFLLPAIMPITPEIYNILTALMELEPTTRRYIGYSMIITTALGLVLMVAGMVGLGLQGLKIFVKDITNAFARFKIAGFAVVPVLALLALGGIVLGYIFTKLDETIGEIIDMLPDLAEEGRKVKESLGIVYDSIIYLSQSLVNIYDVIDNLIKQDFDGVFRAVNLQIQDTIDYIKKLVNLDVGNWGRTLKRALGVIQGGRTGGLKLPDVDIMSEVGKFGRWLGFEDGGIVPGPRNSPQLAVVHGGETISPVGSSGGATVNLSINVDSPSLGGSVDVSDLADEISRSMTRELRRTKIL